MWTSSENIIHCSNEFRQTISFGNKSEYELVKITKSDRNLGGRIVYFLFVRNRKYETDSAHICDLIFYWIFKFAMCWFACSGHMVLTFKNF